MMASAHVCYGNYLPAMGITFTLHPMVMSAMGITFFFKKISHFNFFLKNNFFKSKKKWILFDFVLTYCIGNRSALDYANW